MNYIDTSYEGNGYMYMMIMNENYKTFHMKNSPSVSIMSTMGGMAGKRQCRLGYACVVDTVRKDENFHPDKGEDAGFDHGN